MKGYYDHVREDDIHVIHSEIDRGSEVICITHITYIFNTYTTWGSQSLTTFHIPRDGFGVSYYVNRGGIMIEPVYITLYMQLGGVYKY